MRLGISLTVVECQTGVQRRDTDAVSELPLEFPAKLSSSTRWKSLFHRRVDSCARERERVEAVSGRALLCRKFRRSEAGV